MKMTSRLGALALLSLFVFCTPEKDDDNTPLLALALLGQGPAQPPGFQAVTYTGFSFAGRSTAGAGVAEDKSIQTGVAATPGLERKTSFDMVYTFTATDGEIRVFGSANTNLRTRGDQDTYVRIVPTAVEGWIAGSRFNARAPRTRVISSTVGTSKTLCLDIHREVDTPDRAVKFHYLIWDNRSCGSLTTADRAGNHDFDVETEIWTATRARSELVTMGAQEIHAGFAVRGAVLTNFTTGGPRSTSGSIRANQ